MTWLRDWLVSRQRYGGAQSDAPPGWSVIPVPERSPPPPTRGRGLLPHEVAARGREGSSRADRRPASGSRHRHDGHLRRFVLVLLRYADARNEGLLEPEAIRAGCRSTSVGGVEHDPHLLYSRFITKVLYDAGLVPEDEPFHFSPREWSSVG